MVVKACGLRTLEEVRWAQELGYDLLGLVVEPRSRRYVPLQQLEAIWQQLSEQWRSRCVLVAKHWRTLAYHARRFPAARLQCYDDYPDYIAAARRLQPVHNEEQWQLYQLQERALLYVYDISLGSGQWRGVPHWCQGKKQLLVAGGLSRERLLILAEMARKQGLRFFGFDLSSGLESDADETPSSKDFAKMKDCIQLSRQCFPSVEKL